jgi:hypothetical protein
MSTCEIGIQSLFGLFHFIIFIKHVLSSTNRYPSILLCYLTTICTIELVHFALRVQLFTGDFPARSKCNQQVNHNGFFACSRCLFRGSRCAPPCSRHTLYKWEDFVRDPPQQRTQYHINQCALRLNPTDNNIFGILGLSPLSAIISIPDQSTFDYFHLVSEVHFR